MDDWPDEALAVLDPIRYRIKMNKPPDSSRFKHDWRIDMLAVPKGHKEEQDMFKMNPSQIQMYKREQEAKKIHPAQDREFKRVRRAIDNILDRSLKYQALNPPWVYSWLKKTYKGTRGSGFDHRIDKLLEQSKKSPYYEVAMVKGKGKKRKDSKKGSKKDKKKKGKDGKKGGGSGSGKKAAPAKSNKAKIQEAIEHCIKLAAPKKAFPPPKISRGKHGEVNMHRINKLQAPKYFTPKFVDNTMKTWKNQHYVELTALRANPTDRMLALAIPKIVSMEPPRILGEVQPNALHAKATPRTLALAVPTARNAITETDINEDAFKVSPNALKYKATERIIELAKPRKRD